jgi:hypothetical protein
MEVAASEVPFGLFSSNPDEQHLVSFVQSNLLITCSLGHTLSVLPKHSLPLFYFLSVFYCAKQWVSL